AGGVPELVQDQEGGLLVAANDAVRLAAAVALVLNSPDLASRLGAAGRQRVAERFDSTRSAAILAQLIRGV
ncbi:MAG: glycosyltransferase, partial [Arthrobacter sp.]